MKKILLIEDNDVVRENTAEILELSNYQVITAVNGKEGVELAIKQLPDLIICDIMMPVLDGYGVLHLLNKRQDTATIPFIFLTAKSERSDFRKGMEMGADDYLTKPFDGIELLNAVEMRLKKADLHTGAVPAAFSAFLSEAQQAGARLTSPDREVNEYKKKQLLYTEGQRPVAVYYILKGKVLVRKSNEENKELVTNIHGSNEFFGFTDILEDRNHKETAEFLEDSELMLIPRKDFLELINTSPNVAKQFIKLLASNVAEKEETLLNLAYNSLRKKVANGILYVAGKLKNENASIEISRENLANVVGSATESLIRTLSDFRHEHLIDVKNNKIIILDEEKLANLSC